MSNNKNRNLPINASFRKSRRRQNTLFFSIIMGIVLTISLTSQTAMAQTEEKYCIGIDLGTTNSRVAIWQNGKAEIIPDDQGNKITPSYVSFSNGELLIGDAAKDQATINPKNTIFDIKRLIGRNYNDESVQVDKELLPFKIIPKDDGKAAVQVSQEGNTTTLLPEEVSVMILKKMKSAAESYLGHPVDCVVMAVPAYFNHDRRKAIKDAGAIAGLQIERMLNEPSVATYPSGLHLSGGEKNILVYDLGGRTFDVTMLTIDNGVYEVLSTYGDTYLGGEDFNQRVMQYYINMMKKNDDIDISNDAKAIQKLRKEVERVKRSLSSQMEARLEIDDLINGYDFASKFTRTRFEELNVDLFKKTLGPVKQVLLDSEMSVDDVDEIVLVGGSTRIPKVQSLLSDYFGGKQPLSGMNPDESVVYGAAKLAGLLSSPPLLCSKTYFDDAGILLHYGTVHCFSLGIETVGGIMTKVVKAGSPFEISTSQTFCAYQDNQPTVLIQVYAGEREMTKDNVFLGKFELNGISPSPRGVSQIEVKFQLLDDYGNLQVSAVDKTSGRSQQIKLNLGAFVTNTEVNEMYKYHENGESSSNIPAIDGQELRNVIDGVMDCTEANMEVGKEEHIETLKEVESVANPILSNMHSNGYGANGGDDYDYGSVFDEEL